MDRNELDLFSITNWYPIFKHLTYETIFVPIQVSFFATIYSENENRQMGLPNEFVEEVNKALTRFDKLCFIKNNWHAPIDSKVFSLNNLLQACNYVDVINYISTSSILRDDFENCDYKNFCLAIRPWKHIHPGSEFRCIVIKNILRAISPRHWPIIYPHFKTEGKTIVHVISTFYSQKIKKYFNCENYTFDIVLNFPQDITLVDFGVLYKNCNLYAFKWYEIKNIMEKSDETEYAPVFRYLKTSKISDSKLNAFLLPIK